MAILDELTEQEVSKNKAIRGYIVRALAKGSQNAYRKDSIIKLTRKGVDLVEGTINDPGIDV